MVALATFEATESDQLNLEEGKTYIRLFEDYGNGWSFGMTMDETEEGIFPQTYAEIIN